MIVVYRACPKGNPLKIRPIPDKYELVKTCFRSFIKAFEGVQYDLIVLLDKPNKKFRELFSGYTVEETYYGDFNEGNIKSFHRQIDIALQRKDSFFFVEDDYFFLPDAGQIICDSVKFLPFLTPYDHPGYYTEDIHKYKRTVEIAGNHHWQTIDSTTLTFSGQCESLLKEHATMKKYGWADHPMWCDITKRIPLYCPIPSLATHMETPHLAPLVDWYKHLKTYS